MIPSRRDWRGAYDHPAAIRVEAHEAFGWKVHLHRMPAGSVLVLTASAEVERGLAPNLTLYTGGRICVTGGDGTVFEDRVPGMYSGERPNHPAGVVTLMAAEDSAFWCFSWHANRAALPSLRPIRLQPGDVWPLDAGQRLWILEGQASFGAQSIRSPSSQVVAVAADLVAVSAAYGVNVEADRAA